MSWRFSEALPGVERGGVERVKLEEELQWMPQVAKKKLCDGPSFQWLSRKNHFQSLEKTGWLHLVTVVSFYHDVPDHSDLIFEAHGAYAVGT